MKATGIVRRIEDLGRVVISKEIHHTMRIREGTPSYITLTPFDGFCVAIHNMVERYKAAVE
ncbi:MAG: stage V sporulation protein T [Ruminococcaceae bacterium]|nr:stage V sporulation protein T [Oscillospiraceae bacterium]